MGLQLICGLFPFVFLTPVKDGIKPFSFYDPSTEGKACKTNLQPITRSHFFKNDKGLIQGHGGGRVDSRHLQFQKLNESLVIIQNKKIKQKEEEEFEKMEF